MSTPDNIERKQPSELDNIIFGYRREVNDLMYSTERTQVETIINELLGFINPSDYWKKNDLLNYILTWNLWSNKNKELEKMVQYVIYWSYEYSSVKTWNIKPWTWKLKYILDNHWRDIKKILKEIQDEEKKIRARASSSQKEQWKKEWVLNRLKDMYNYWIDKLSNLRSLITIDLPSIVTTWVKDNLFSPEKQKNTENINEIYKKLQWKEKPDFFPFYLAMQWYNKQKDKIWNAKYLTVVDYSKPVSQNRLYVMNMQTLMVENCVPTWHGKNSGDTKTTSKFSNINNSYQTSIGFFRTPYKLTPNSKWTRRGLFLSWQEFSNDNATKRWIAVHGVWDFFYARTEKGHRAWESTSEGCITIRNKDNPNEIMNKIKGDSLIYSYYPDMTYLNKSSLIA